MGKTISDDEYCLDDLNSSWYLLEFLGQQSLCQPSTFCADCLWSVTVMWHALTLR